MNKNTLKWWVIAIVLLLILAFVVPVHIAASLKGFYFIGGGLIALYFIYLAFKNADSMLFLFNAEKRRNAPKLSNVKKFLLALLVIVNIGFIGAFTSMRIDDKLKKEGVLGYAVIMSGEHRKVTSVKRGVENTYTLDFYYKTQDGERIESSETVSAAQYAKVAVGAPISIIYLPSHPKVMKLLIDEETKLEFKR